MTWRVVSTVVLALVLAGCGSSSADEDDAPPSDLVDASSPSPRAEELRSLKFGEAATTQVTPSGSPGGATVAITVESVRTGATGDFAGLEGPGVTGDRQPYYVDLSVAHRSGPELAGLDAQVFLQDLAPGGGGVLSPPWGFAEPFEPCPGGPLPDGFAPGDRAELCLVFIASAGTSFGSVVLLDAESRPEISWTGEPTRAVRPTKRARR